MCLKRELGQFKGGLSEKGGGGIFKEGGGGDTPMHTLVMQLTAESKEVVSQVEVVGKYEHTGLPHRKLFYDPGGGGGDGIGKNVGHRGQLTVKNFKITLTKKL